MQCVQLLACRAFSASAAELLVSYFGRHVIWCLSGIRCRDLQERASTVMTMFCHETLIHAHVQLYYY